MSRIITVYQQCGLRQFFSPPRSDSLRKRTLVLLQMFIYFFSTRDLRDAWVDRREILHGGQY